MSLRPTGVVICCLAFCLLSIQFLRWCDDSGFHKVHRKQTHGVRPSVKSFIYSTGTQQHLQLCMSEAARDEQQVRKRLSSCSTSLCPVRRDSQNRRDSSGLCGAAISVYLLYKWMCVRAEGICVSVCVHVHALLCVSVCFQHVNTLFCINCSVGIKCVDEYQLCLVGRQQHTRLPEVVLVETPCLPWKEQRLCQHQKKLYNFYQS